MKTTFRPLTLALFLVGCAHDASIPSPSTPKPMTSEEIKTKNETAIRDQISRFADAFHVKDVEGCMAIFSPDIVSFDILPPLQTVSAEKFVKHWEEFFDSYEGPIHLEFPDVRVVTDGEVAFSYCLHRVTGMLKNGDKKDYWLRWTAGWKKLNGKWLVIHEQVSVPTDFRTGKALLDLKP